MRYYVTIDNKDGKTNKYEFTREEDAVKRVKNSFTYNKKKGNWASFDHNFYCATPFWVIYYSDNTSACCKMDIEP